MHTIDRDDCVVEVAIVEILSDVGSWLDEAALLVVASECHQHAIVVRRNYAN